MPTPASDPARARRRRRGPARPAPVAARPAGASRPPAATPAPAPAATAAVAAAPTGPVETDFAALGVPTVLLKVLAERGATAAFPIQSATLPDSLAGRDVLGRGKTGSGKTIAFALPLAIRLADSGRARQPGRPRGLVLVPTRELANQVAETLQPIARALSLSVTTIFGGVGQGNQVTALKRGVDIVVACPGRLEDLMGQGHCRLDAVEITVLDEADHMADLGFLPGVKRIMDATPAKGQRLLFSATLDNGIDVLVRRYLDQPVVHSVDPVATPVAAMTHHVFAVSAVDKVAVVNALASGLDRSLLFTRTKHGAKKLTRQLNAAGIPTVELHGNLSQNARERNLADFSGGDVRVLVATDIAARGIHVDDIALVVHVDPPAEHKAFLHRSGRTARAGAGGVVVTVMTPDQERDVRALARAAGINPKVTPVHPAHALLTELVGPPAPKVAPRPAPVVPAAAPRGGGRRTGSGPAPARSGGARTGSGAARGGGNSRGGRGRSR